MKAIKTILAMTVMMGVALAQAPAAKKPKPPASQAVAAEPAPAAAPAAKPAVAPNKAATAKKPAAQPVVAAPAAPAPAATAAPQTAAAATKPAGRRDPFINPIVRTTGGPGAVCSTGKRCLVISEMMLRGIVKTQTGMIAVVSNQANRAYFLKENDPVFNGVVVKITGDSVIFKENVVDNLGRESSREVVKRVNAPTV